MANLLLIVVDCLRADMLARGRGAWPRMSGLAAGGARFTDCYSTCPTTTPAVTAILTGRYPSAHGVRGLRGTQLERVASPPSPSSSAEAGFATLVLGHRAAARHRRHVPRLRRRRVPRRAPALRALAVGRREHRAAGAARGRASGRSSRSCTCGTRTRRAATRPEFEDRRHGRNAYERAIAGMDAWIGDAVEAAGPDTVVVLTGDHGENVVFEPHNLREQAAWRRINQRLPIARWSQATVDHGVRSHSKRALRWAPRYFWNHGQTLLEPLVRVPLVVSGPGVVRGRAANAGEPRRPGADAGRPGRRRRTPPPGWQGVSLAASLRGGGEPPAHPVAMEIAVAPSIPAIRQQAHPRRPPQADHLVRRRARRPTPCTTSRPIRASAGTCSLAEPGLAERLRETLRELAPSGPRRWRWPPTRTRRSPSGCASWATCRTRGVDWPVGWLP